MKGITSDTRSTRCRELVEQILRDQPAARKSDMVLLQRVWELQGFQMPPRFFTEAADAETLISWRKKFQLNGQYNAENPSKKTVERDGRRQ